MDDVIPLSVSCTALPIILAFTALCWFTLSSAHFTPTDARSYNSLDQILPFSSILLKPSKCTPVDYLCFPWSRGRVRSDLLWGSGKVVVSPISLNDWWIQEVCVKKGFAKAQLTSENSVTRKARTWEQSSNSRKLGPNSLSYKVMFFLGITKWLEFTHWIQDN